MMANKTLITHSQGLETLQRMRICHRDLSPENVILLDNTSLVIDFGMCLRIPYSEDGMTYSEHGNVRHRIKRKNPCGKPVCYYFQFDSIFMHASFGSNMSILNWSTSHSRTQPHMSPETFTARDFDGHAVDIWAGENCMHML